MTHKLNGWLTAANPSFKVVRLEESAPWRVELNSPTQRWLTMLDSGKGNRVTAELELLLRKSSGFMDMFVQQPLPPYEQLWRRIDQDAPYRTELVARTWAAMYQANAKLLDNWLANQQLDLPPAQLRSLEEARRVCWYKRKDHASVIRSMVTELTPTSRLTELIRIIPLLEEEKRNGGTLWRQESTATLLDSMLADDQLEPRHRAAILFLREENSVAWVLLRDKLDDPGDLNPAEIDSLANSYLWRVLMTTIDTAEIAEAFALAKAKLSTRAMEDKNLAHTFACAAAEVGELLMAFDYLTKHGTSEPYDELLRELILKRCGFDDVANELLRNIVNEKVGNGSTVIAKLRL